ncbi:MAG: 2,3-bisphosphoglycerate-independent phosphoglycerate mutase [Pseudanabaenaceae cyanobacterium]
MSAAVSPVVLVILDGWGYREEKDGNAIAAAKTPVMDSLWQTYPHTLLQASGKDVGLPKGQMGNSEVGHLNIGAGRIVPQELVRISDAVEDGTILHNPTLTALCDKIKGHKLHLLGLCSDGGVHSHIYHLIALLDVAKLHGISEVCIHAILDGRDTPPTSGLGYMDYLQEAIDRRGIGRIVTVSGRYFAMDRDRRWDRVQKAYQVLTTPEMGQYTNARDLIQACYDQNITDEFIPPTRIAPGVIEAGDGVVFCNFRPDRARELTQALVDPQFQGFARQLISPLAMVTFTQYDPNLAVEVVFPPQTLTNLLGQVIAEHGLRQFRIAETEKYAHVTYFFDGGREEPNPLEDRHLVNSPQVSTYDQQPAMSAREVTKILKNAIEQGVYSFIVVNYANPDMVGHTGNYEATVAAIEQVDYCLGEVLESVGRVGGTVLITADHGNAEMMWDEHRQPWTAHTSNPVPFILVEGERRKIPGFGGEVKLRSGGRLADIAPTVLQILGLPQPPEMTGVSLIESAEYELITPRMPVKIGA